MKEENAYNYSDNSVIDYLFVVLLLTIVYVLIPFAVLRMQGVEFQTHAEYKAEIAHEISTRIDALPTNNSSFLKVWRKEYGANAATTDDLSRILSRPELEKYKGLAPTNDKAIFWYYALEEYAKRVNVDPESEFRVVRDGRFGSFYKVLTLEEYRNRHKKEKGE